MRPRFLLYISLALLFAVSQAAAQDDAVKKELEKFQGTWDVTSIEVDGNKQSREKEPPMKLIWQGDKYTQTIADMVWERGSVKIDPTKKYKTIDFIITEGRDKGKPQNGLYELDGDTLKLCLPQPGTEQRPTEFTAKQGSGLMLFVMKKAKPEKEKEKEKP